MTALFDAKEYLIAGLENQAEWWEHLGDAHRDYAALAHEAAGLEEQFEALCKAAEQCDATAHATKNGGNTHIVIPMTYWLGVVEILDANGYIGGPSNPANRYGDVVKAPEADSDVCHTEAQSPSKRPDDPAGYIELDDQHKCPHGVHKGLGCRVCDPASEPEGT